MDFYERLEWATIKKMHKNRLLNGVDATIETLREMAVGEPISVIVGKVKMEQYRDVYGLADIHVFSQMMTPEGKKVTVMVFSDGN